MVCKSFYSSLCLHPLAETLPCGHALSIYRAVEDGLYAQGEGRAEAVGEQLVSFSVRPGS